MTSKKQNSHNNFDQKHFTSMTKKRFRKKFKKSITATEINKVWKDFVQYGIVEKLLDGDCVKIDKHSTIQVVGVKITEDKRLMDLLKRGKIQRSDGSIKKAGLLGRRNDVKYKIVYKNRLAKSEVYFKATQQIRKQLTEVLNNTNIYFHIKPITNS